MDGGYVIVDGFNYDLLISCGIDRDVSFEEDFLSRWPIECLAFDGTITSFPDSIAKMIWKQCNISNINGPNTTNLHEWR
jgi:hypothetical protein